MAERFDRFDAAAVRALQTAQEEALAAEQPVIGALHLLLGVLQDRTSVASAMLARLGVDVDALVEAARESAAEEPEAPFGGTGLGRYAARALERALRDMRDEGALRVDVGNMLIGLVGCGSRSIDRLCIPRGITLDVLRTTRRGIDVSDSSAERRALMSRVLGYRYGARHFGRTAVMAILQAELVARWFYHQEVDSPHLLAGLLRMRSSVALRVLGEASMPLEPSAYVPAPGADAPARDVGFTPSTEATLVRAFDLAQHHGVAQVGSAHLLRAILEDEACREVLARLQVDVEALQAQLEGELDAPED
jgi:ATP-dependent Clp protease ATP-binding subunit ClpA